MPDLLVTLTMRVKEHLNKSGTADMIQNSVKMVGMTFLHTELHFVRSVVKLYLKNYNVLAVVLVIPATFTYSIVGCDIIKPRETVALVISGEIQKIKGAFQWKKDSITISFN